MIIRATKKVLTVSRLPSMKLDREVTETFPGEWYVDLISLGKPGKFGLHFIHQPTLISIVLPGRSILNEFHHFHDRLKNILRRNGYEKLVPLYIQDPIPDIFTTNSRMMLAYLNQVKYDSEYHCKKAESIDKINLDWIEDILLESLFGSKETPNKYKSPKDILKSELNKYV